MSRLSGFLARLGKTEFAETSNRSLGSLPFSALGRARSRWRFSRRFLFFVLLLSLVLRRGCCLGVPLHPFVIQLFLLLWLHAKETDTEALVKATFGGVNLLARSTGSQTHAGRCLAGDFVLYMVDI